MEYINGLNVRTNEEYNIENNTEINTSVFKKQDGDITRPSIELINDDKELIDFFSVNDVFKIRKLHTEVLRLKSQNKPKLLKAKQIELNKLLKNINKYNQKTANMIMKELKRGRITFPQLSCLLYIDEIYPNTFIKSIKNYIRDNNITIIAYRRKQSNEHFCISVNPNDKNLNLDVLRLTVQKIYRNNDDSLSIKTYTHGTWADMRDLERAGYYKNRKAYDEDYNNKNPNTNYNAWVNSRYTDISYNENTNSDQTADIYIYNNNYPKHSLIEVPTVSGMENRAMKSAKILNKVLDVIEDEQNKIIEEAEQDENPQQKLHKEIIMCGVSNGNIHMLKNIKYLDNNKLDDKTALNIVMESIPSFGTFTAAPRTETSKFFIESILNDKKLFDTIGRVKIDTNLSKKFHNYSAVYEFLEGVYKYFIYDNKISLNQMEQFNNKLDIADKLREKSNEIYEEAIKKKKKWQSMSEEEKIKNTELESYIFVIYLLMCLTIIGAFFYYHMQKWQKENNDKKYLNKIHIKNYSVETPSHNSNNTKTLNNKEITINKNNSNQIRI